ncbi:MAG: discoidin domain-containing protein [Dysgonamonadaceae bacterium]|jgi:hypothetical protein|nr:discoidin domain-containing protein [Dysgonamonadaceae bacterium]
MKRNIIGLISLLSVILVFMLSCDDKYYNIDNDFYKNKKVMVRNPLNGDTLRIEQNNTDQIMLKEPDDSTIVFDNRGFIFKLEKDNIVSITEDGAVTPISRGVTRLDIIFRSNANLNTSIFVEVYKQYQAVEGIYIPVSMENKIIEVGESFDLAPHIVAVPVNADNRKLHFSMAESSQQYASITDEGVVTGLQTTGRNRAVVKIVSDENDTITADFRIQVVNEILVTSVNLLQGLDGVEIGLGETIDLNLCTSVSPDNVNVNNKKLSFALLEGADVLSLNADGVITAIGVGTAKLSATSKNGISREFSIIVKTGITDLTRLLWSVTTSVDYGFYPDAATGMPEDMFDNKNDTYFAVVKPGKSFNGFSTPSDHTPYFIVDMKTAQKFNYIRWNHRSSNGESYLRVWGIKIAGSVGGETFTDISQSDIAIPYESNTSTFHINIPESEYRYVKVYLTKWSDNSGGSTSGNTMQIAEFGLGLQK